MIVHFTYCSVYSSCYCLQSSKLNLLFIMFQVHCNLKKLKPSTHVLDQTQIGTLFQASSHRQPYFSRHQSPKSTLLKFSTLLKLTVNLSSIADPTFYLNSQSNSTRGVNILMAQHSCQRGASCGCRFLVEGYEVYVCHRELK